MNSETIQYIFVKKKIDFKIKDLYIYKKCKVTITKLLQPAEKF